MADFPAQSQDYNRVTINPLSPESIGVDVGANALTTASATWPTANRAIYIPFVVMTSFTVVKMFVANGTAVSGNVDVGIYDTAGSRLVSAGSTAQSGTSAVQSFDVTDTTLRPGVYYMAVAMDNTTGTLISVAPAVAVSSAMGVLSQSTAFALPSTATFAAAADAFVPMVGITARTVI